MGVKTLPWNPLSRERTKISEDGMTYSSLSPAWNSNKEQDFLDWRDFEWVDDDDEHIVWAPSSFFPSQLVDEIQKIESKGLTRFSVFSEFHHGSDEGSLNYFGQLNASGQLTDEYLCGLDYKLRVLARFGDPIAMLRLAKMRIAEHGWHPGVFHLDEANRWYWRADFIRGSTYPEEPWIDEFLERESETLEELVNLAHNALKDMPAPEDGYESEVCELHGVLAHWSEDAPFKCLEHKAEVSSVKKKASKKQVKGKNQIDIQHSETASPGFCTKCGTRRAEGDIFCGSCGNNLQHAGNHISVNGERGQGSKRFGFVVQLTGPLTEGDFADSFGSPLDEFETDDDVYEFVERVWDNHFFRVQYSGKLKHREFRDSKPFGNFEEDEVIEDEQTGYWTDLEVDRATGTYTYRMAKEISIAVLADSKEEAEEFVMKNAKRAFTIEDLDSGGSLSPVAGVAILSTIEA
jgi:hypothetical protein